MRICKEFDCKRKVFCILNDWLSYEIFKDVKNLEECPCNLCIIKCMCSQRCSIFYSYAYSLTKYDFFKRRSDEVGRIK